jgi:hypothetical protein
MEREPTSETQEVVDTVASVGSAMQGGPASVSHFETTIHTSTGETITGHGRSAEEAQHDASERYDDWKEDRR